MYIIEKVILDGVKNLNIRCIEMYIALSSNKDKKEKNLNIRCIEIG